jgi:hypothetical protein
MSLGPRRGASLVELAVALTMFGVVAAVLFRMLAANLSLYQAQTQRIDRRQSIRAAELILPAELRELDATDGDLIAIAPTSVTLRAPRQVGFVCAPAGAGAAHLAIRQRPLFGVRDFDPGTDGLLVHVRGDSTDPDADAWLVGSLSSLRNGTCADGAPARLLETSLAADRRIGLGAPVRGFEVVTYRLYRGGDGEWYVGVVAGSGGTTQPVIGPVTAAGFELRYLDAAGAPVGDPARVAAIEIRLRAPTAQAVRGAAGITRQTDSTVIVVALRNNRRS